MSQDYSNEPLGDNGLEENLKASKKQNWWKLAILPAWVVICFFAAQLIVVMPIIYITGELKIPLGVDNKNVLNAITSVLIYLLTIFLVIFLPYKIKKAKTTYEELGMTRLPSWMDILITPAGFIVYIILSAILVLMATHLLPGFNVDQTQNVGFTGLTQQYEYVLAFMTLVVVAPLTEEILFRGYLFGKLKKYVPVWVAVIVTSLLFGFIHGNWNVAVDTFALSVVLCILRELTGNIWSSVLLHMVKNGIAFYILFIYPTLLTTLVK